MSLDSQTDRASHWGITINNPTEDDRLQLRTQMRFVRMVRGQDEVGENGTQHIQAYANTDQVRLSQMKSWLPRAHFVPLKSKQHIDNMINYVWKEDDTAVADTRFEIKHRTNENGQSLTMAQTMTMFAEYAFSSAEILRLTTDEYDADRVCIRKAIKEKDVYEKEFWHCVNIMLTRNPDLVGLLTQPQYMRAWVNTRQVWLAKYQVDSQTNITVYPDTPPDTPVAVISNDLV